MISEMRLRLGLSLGASWHAILGREVRCGEVLGLQHSQQRSTSSCGENRQSECLGPCLVRTKFTNVPAAKISSPSIYRYPIVDYTRLQIIQWLSPPPCSLTSLPHVQNCAVRAKIDDDHLTACRSEQIF